MFKIQKLMLISFLVLFSVLQAKGLREIAHLPHAQDLIKKVFKERGLDPKDFEFTFYNKKGSWCYVLGKNTFGCDLIFLERLNQLAKEIKEESSIKGRLINYVTGRDKKFNESVLLLEGFLGHEIQHHFDRDDLTRAIVLFNGSHELKREIFLALERKADLLSSNNPEVLRALASYFEKFYQEYVVTIKYIERIKAQGFSIQEPEEDKDHPHPLERASYLREKAGQLEAAQKLAAQKLAARRLEWGKEEDYLMLSN
ncbi:MAG: hypothetical protein LVQ75_00370 [Candidatus Babeliales bacterium]|jgi:hypothetical protein